MVLAASIFYELGLPHVFAELGLYSAVVLSNGEVYLHLCTHRFGCSQLLSGWMGGGVIRLPRI